MKSRVLPVCFGVLLCAVLTLRRAVADEPEAPTAHQIESLRLAVDHLIETFDDRYPNGRDYRRQLEALAADTAASPAERMRRFQQLRRQALLANPLLDFDELIVLRRRRGQLGLPVNHKCNSGIPQTGYDNDVAVLSPVRPDGRLRTLYRPPQRRYVGEFDLHFDADRLLLTMPDGRNWHLHELRLADGQLRQITPGDQTDVDHFDGCYLPDGRIVFASTASFTAVPCWHGKQRACSLYRCNADGSGMRQLCFDQDLDLHPAVLPTGQIIYSRWDYSGTMHIYLRPLMVMNPDGTGQRAVYGSNSYWPNALFYPQGVPGAPGKVAAIVAGYHGVPRMGQLALIDPQRGWHEADGVVQRIPGRGRPIEPIIRDNLVDKVWPKLLHPLPLSEHFLLVAAQLHAGAPWGIYLVDVFDNVVPLQVDPQFDLFEPIPLRPRTRPPAIPDRVDLARNDAVVYLHDVYAGPGLAGVPRGTIKNLRIVAYHFGYPGMAGPDKIGCGGPWEAMRILGTVPVGDDGSVAFRVPACTPLTVQPLDAEGKAVQLMRSWFTAMPGEVVSCVGCHERPKQVPAVRYETAATRRPEPIRPWRGPPRGFDFGREVQPVLDRHCVGCHNGERPDGGQPIPDLRREELIDDYQGRQLTKLGATRLHPDVRQHLGGTAVRYTPAYEALTPFIRRVNVEDDVHLLAPGEYHADTSRLVQMLQKGHHGVRLDEEAWDRLVTWIDLNGPCHGTWGDVAPVPDAAATRRRELARRYGGPAVDPEERPTPTTVTRDVAEPLAIAPPPQQPTIDNWPLTAEQAQRQQAAREPINKTIDLGDGVALRLVRIPAGRFLMGTPDGPADERPLDEVVVARDFWMAACETTNAQMRRFAAEHDPGLFNKRFQGGDGPGLSLDGPARPAVRVSWIEATAFCRWLSQRTGTTFLLPTEAQWEYACRAGAATPLHFGHVGSDFSRYANLADKSLSLPPGPTGGLESNITAHHGKGIFLSAIVGGNIPCDARFDDRAVATAPVGSYTANAWGLFDMHGNAAEWTRSRYRPYPYRDEDGRNAPGDDGQRVVRGGSWVDRPQQAAAGHRLAYPAWQRVHNVGFRVVCQVDGS